MTIKNSILDKYSKIENNVISTKTIVAETINTYTGINIKLLEIDIKEKVAILQVSSVIKSLIFEKKLEIENDLVRRNLQITTIQKKPL